MAGVPGRSGGSNRLSLEAHLARGTFRSDRHAHLIKPEEATPLSAADRRRVLNGLRGEPRRVAAAVLAEYGGWDAASLRTLRSYAWSLARLEGLEGTAGSDPRVLHRELRIAIHLYRTLNLQGAT